MLLLQVPSETEVVDCWFCAVKTVIKLNVCVNLICIFNHIWRVEYWRNLFPWKDQESLKDIFCIDAAKLLLNLIFKYPLTQLRHLLCKKSDTTFVLLAGENNRSPSYQHHAQRQINGQKLAKRQNVFDVSRHSFGAQRLLAILSKQPENQTTKCSLLHARANPI